MRKNTFTFLRTLFLTITLPIILITFASCEQEEESEALNYPKAVDLGLSVKWATYNVGAESPEDYGDYYAWGEVKVKNSYSWSTYKWCNGYYNELTKYCTKSRYGLVDNKTALDLLDDAAHVKWRSGSHNRWRMPTKDEMQELIDDCDWEWTTLRGVEGHKVTGPNGNFIFLPAAGYRNGEEIFHCGTNGYYWTAALSDYYSAFYPADEEFRLTIDNSDAYCLYIGTYDYDRRRYDRCYGCTIRPVTE